MAVAMIVAAGACSKDDGPDDDMIWDISPANVIIQLVDEDGNNLLDPAVAGNFVGEPMSIGYQEEAYIAIWKREELQPETRYYMPYFYGFVWSGIFSDKRYALYFGDFDGATSQDLKLTFGILDINTVHEFEFSHRIVWKNKKPHFDDYITYKGQRIEGSTLTLVVPKNPSSDKAD